MKKMGFVVLAAIGMTMGPQIAGAEAPTEIATPSDAQVERAERKAGEILAGLDPQRMFSEPGYAERNRTAIEVLRPLVRDPRTLRAIDMLRQVSFLAEGRNDESLDVAKVLISREPETAETYPAGFWAAIYARRPAEAVAMIESAARHVKDAEARAELRSALDTELIFGILRPLKEAKDDASRFRLAEALLVLVGDDRSVSWLDYIRSLALDGRLASGKTDEARAIARTIIDPREVIRLVGARRYDALFDASVDRRKAVETAIAEWDKATAEQLRGKPDDLDVILRRAQHLRSVGKEKEALELLLPRTADPAAIGKTGEPAFWIVNEAAFALGGLGKHDEAIRLMEKLLTLPLEEHPALISMAINHGVILADGGRYREAATWETELQAKQSNVASEYGYMWMWSTIACAESMVGNTQAAAPWLAKLAASSDKNEAAHMRALLCANEMGRAEALLLDRLNGPDADQLLIALHRYEIETDPSSRAKAIAGRLETLLERPAVKAAVAKVGQRLTLPLSKTYWGDI
jgi:tetratricopeptide (TPR) repeat protein